MIISRIKQIILISLCFGMIFIFGLISFYLFKNGQVVLVLSMVLFATIGIIIFFDKIEYIFNYKKIVIDDIERKIKNINEELKLLPNDELLLDIKETKRKIIEELTKQLNDTKKIYFRNMFKNIYVLIPPNTKSSNEIKKAYSIIAEKYFGTNKVKFITVDEMKNEIEKLESIYSKNELESLNDKFIKVISKDYDISIKRDYIDFRKI